LSAVLHRAPRRARLRSDDLRGVSEGQGEEERIRKDVVKDTEVVEEDVRREEIEVEAETERGSR
jgi:hypothetical protein